MLFMSLIFFNKLFLHFFFGSLMFIKNGFFLNILCEFLKARFFIYNPFFADIMADCFLVLPPLTKDSTVILGKNSQRPTTEVQEVVYKRAESYSDNVKVQVLYSLHGFVGLYKHSQFNLDDMHVAG